MRKKKLQHKRTEICLEPDGFSIHTFEVSMQLSKSEWHNCKEKLFSDQMKARKIWIYADKSCKGLFICTKYAETGIRIRLEHIGSKKDHSKYFVHMIINPRKLIFPQSGYLDSQRPGSSGFSLY